MNQSANPPIIYGMLCTVVSPNKRIVLLKRSPGKKVYPNLWAVVGAYPFKEKVDMATIALREITDELGLNGNIIRVGNEIVNKVELEGKLIELHVVPVLATVNSEEVILNNEHTEYVWVDIDNVSSVELAPGMLDVMLAVNTEEYINSL